MTHQRHAVAVIGSGIAGATVARALASAGHSVHVFDKARGPGGRLATRQVEWVDRRGHAATTRLDHGALGFTARSAAFQTYVDLALQAGCLAQWKPKLAAGGLLLEHGAMLYVPTPDMPALCRHLLDGIPASLSIAVDALHKGPLGWQVQAGVVRPASKFDAVVLALPPRAGRAPAQPASARLGAARVHCPDAGTACAAPARHRPRSAPSSTSTVRERVACHPRQARSAAPAPRLMARVNCSRWLSFQHASMTRST